MIASLGEAFREGGWGMYPTLIFGTITLAIAVRHAVRPLRSLEPLIMGLTAACVFSGLLGATAGLIRTMHYAAHEPMDKALMFALIGTAESLNNIGLAMVLSILVALVAGVGGYRERRGASKFA